jgi:glycogen operon protein
MTDADWAVDYARSLGVFLNGAAIPDPDIHGRRIIDDSFYLLFNGWDEEIAFTLPNSRWTAFWEVVLDSGDFRTGAAGARARYVAGTNLDVPGHRLLLLESTTHANTPN